MAQRRILITGANGFFGSRFHQRFQQRHTILATDVDTLDINDEAKVTEVFADFRPNLVLHAAAVAATAFCDAHPDIAHRINVEGALVLARAAARHDAGMVFISSEQVFNGNPEAGPYAETHRAMPDTIYGRTKLLAEAELAKVLEKLWVLRFTWLFGLPERGCGMSPGVPWNIVQSLIAGRKLSERSNEFRGITYVHDLLDRFEAILECPPNTYHVGSSNELSRYDLARLTLERLGVGRRAPEVLEAIEAPARRDVRLDTHRLAAAGVVFPDSTDAVTRCLSDFRFSV